MAKKLPKKPKAPKASASLATWENHKKRLQEWEKACNQIKNDAKRKATLIGAIRRMK